MLTNAPVLVLPVVSMKLNAAAVDVPVSAPLVNNQFGLAGEAFAAHVKAVVSPAGMVMERVPVGAVSEDQGPLLHAPHVAATELLPDEIKHCPLLPTVVGNIRVYVLLVVPGLSVMAPALLPLSMVNVPVVG